MLEHARRGRPATADYHPWTTYLDARHEARRRGDHKVGTEHLVLALLMEPALAGALGTDLASARAQLETLDRDALGAVGVVLSGPGPFAPGPDTPGQAAGTLPDADQFAGRERRPKLKDVLEGRLPLTPAAKTLLRDSTKEMRRVGGRHVGPQHVLAALLELDPPDPAAELFAGLGVDRAAVRARLSDL
jgi:Clp amino terminal domain, pathogenicity island component